MSLPTEESFLKDVATHAITVHQDHGIYRHITFARPGTNCYRFDLVTWPGYLAYSGDMGCYVFSRISDMFAFFRADEGKEGLQINLSYWAEKAEARDRDGIKEYSESQFCENVRRWLVEYGDPSDADKEAAEEEVISAAGDGEHAAYTAVHNFTGPDGYQFTDFFECSSEEYTHRFVWCCYALSWGIKQYDGALLEIKV